MARGHGTLRSQIEAALREAARSGRLRPNSLLPSSRVLARDLGVSRGVVVGAYDGFIVEVTMPPSADWSARFSASIEHARALRFRPFRFVHRLTQ